MHTLLLSALFLGATCANILAADARYGSTNPSSTPGSPTIGASWPDRRPLGRIIFAQQGKITASNLNGWNNGGPNALGVAAFQQDILSRVNQAVANTQNMHGQGIVIWDITGCGKTTLGLMDESYLGDPRFLDPEGAGLTVPTSHSPYVPATSALGLHGIEPAMKSIAKQIFAAIRSKGLQAGICVRAEKAYVDANGNLDGSHGLYGDNQPPYDAVLNQLADLDAKITYAYKNWDCRIFYVDSNAASQDVIPAQQKQLNPTVAPAWVYSQLNIRHPDCVIFPEEHYNASFTFSNPAINDPNYQYERVASRYTQLDNQWQHPFLNADELATVPDAFTLICVSNMGASDLADTPDVITALKNNRCILMADAWYNDPGITLVHYWQTQAGVNGF